MHMLLLWSLEFVPGVHGVRMDPKDLFLCVLTSLLYLLQGAECPLLMMSCRMAAPSTMVAVSKSLLPTFIYQVTAPSPL